VANDHVIRLDLNNPVFQEALFSLQKVERLAALDTLKKKIDGSPGGNSMRIRAFVGKK
jgi:hypothetical protein